MPNIGLSLRQFSKYVEFRPIYNLGVFFPANLIDESLCVLLSWPRINGASRPSIFSSTLVWQIITKFPKRAQDYHQAAFVCFVVPAGDCWLRGCGFRCT